MKGTVLGIGYQICGVVKNIGSGPLLVLPSYLISSKTLALKQKYKCFFGLELKVFPNWASVCHCRLQRIHGP